MKTLPHTLLVLLIVTASTHAQEAESVSRLGDGLLERKDLQAIVELQARRDAKSIEAFFGSKDSGVRARAAFAMGSVQSATAIPGLLRLLDDPVATVRVDAAFALRQTAGTVPSGVLLEHLRIERDTVVRAMLLGALGFKGDAKSYEKVTALDPAGAEIAHILSAIYYLQRGIITEAGIQKVRGLLDHKDDSVREHAGYFFYTMSREEIEKPALTSDIVKYVQKMSFADPAAPYLLAYIASAGREEDLPIFLSWSVRGKSLRARSKAVAGLGAFLSMQKARDRLMEAVTSDEYHVAARAGAIISVCTHFDEADRSRLKKLVVGGLVQAEPANEILKVLWAAGDRETVYALIGEIEDTEEKRFMAAISAIEEIEHARVTDRVMRLSGSKDQQVQSMIGLYLAAQVGRADSGVGIDAVEAYLDRVPYVRLRSDTLYELAASLARSIKRQEMIAIYRRLFVKFEAVDDLQSAAACLVILGWTQEAAVLPVLRKELSHTNKTIRAAARGGLSLVGAGDLMAPEFYSVKFSPMMTIDWKLLSRYGRFPKLVMTTALGDVVVRMDAEQAPMGVQNLIQHVKAGRFADIAFYRVEPNHVVQTAPHGHFGERVMSEFTRIAKEENTMGLGDLGKDTLSQHIAITHLMRPHNEGKYTNLGHVIKGGDVVKTMTKYSPVLRSRVIPN